MVKPSAAYAGPGSSVNEAPMRLQPLRGAFPRGI